MKTRFNFTVFCLLVFCTAHAQSTITGNITDEQKKPVFFATIALYNASDSTIEKSASTDEKGNYEIKNILDGKYFLEVSFLGYESIQVENINFPDEDGKSFDAILATNSETLETVEVVAKVPLLEQKPDRLVVNVENNLIGMNSSLLDVMKKIPGMLVINNKLSMAGQSNITILLNGKRTEYMDIQSLLRDMPGDNIKKVEIIHQPGAEFDAAGSGPIINIIFKKNSLFGTNGTFTAGLGKGTDWRYNSALSLNHYQGGLNINGSIGYIKSAYVETLVINRNINGDIYDQVNTDPGRPGTFRTSLTADWNIKEKHELGFTGRYIASGTKKISNNVTRIDFAEDGESDLSLITRNNSDRSWDFVFVNPYYTYIFDSTDHKLDVDFNFARFKNEGDNLLTTQEFNINEFFPSQRYDQPGSTNILASRIDYYRPLSKAMNLQVGVKFSTADLDNDLKSYTENIDGEWVNNTLQSNRFIFEETIYAGYTKLNFSKGKWAGTLGLRYENSKTVGRSVTLDSTFSRNIAKVFPSFSLAKDFNDIFGATIAYSYRIDRPKYYSLNPFVYYWDPYTYEKGNPSLTPSLTHSFKMNLTYEKEPFFSIEYKLSEDAMVEVTEQDDETGEAYTTTLNLEKNNLFSSSFYFPLDITPAISGYGGISANHVTYNSRYLNDEFVRAQWNFSAFIEASFKLPWKIDAELNAWYDSGNQEGILKSEWSYGIGVGFGRKFLDNKINISLGFEDIFNRFWHASINYANMDIDVINKWDAPVVSMKFSYNFGNQHIKGSSSRKSSSSDEINRANNN